MIAVVSTSAKVSKAKGVSVTAAVVKFPCECQRRDVPAFGGCNACEGAEEMLEPIRITTTQRPGFPTPNSAAIHALHLGVAVALAKGATKLEVFSASKNAVKVVDGTGGNHETRLDAYAAAYVITWTRNLATSGGSWSFRHRPAAEMPEAVELAAAALKDAEGALGGPEQMALV